MFDPERDLLTTILADVAQEPAPGASPSVSWSDARDAVTASAETTPELLSAIAARDRAALRRMIEQWKSNERPLPDHDRELLKSALKAYRKRLKLTVLDAESSIGGGPMSAGRTSSIVGIVPPERYPRTVWNELARQKRLIAGDRGTYELPKE